MANLGKSDIRVNHVFRENPVFDNIFKSDNALQMTVNAGAIGLGCGGIHWIDLALYLSNSKSGKLISGKLDSVPIASGRGKQFRDYGGNGLFEFEDGSTLFLNVSAESSANPVCVITQNHCQLVVDLSNGIFVHEREEGLVHPNYLYGKGYHSHKASNLSSIGPSEQTRLWLQHAKGDRRSKLPTLDEAVIGHELLFDLLETGGTRKFLFT
ncbi:MAG: hypothetical protein ISR45_03665 [Rhodospirillales bacterium]|nr:hypothetical protein [Rhodospirillales bacterium]